MRYIFKLSYLTLLFFCSTTSIATQKQPTNTSEDTHNAQHQNTVDAVHTSADDIPSNTSSNTEPATSAQETTTTGTTAPLNENTYNPPKLEQDMWPRRYIGNSFLGLVKTTDKWLGGKHYKDENRSFLKAEIQATAFEQRDNETDLRLRAKVHLPGTKKRLKLFVDSDLEQNQALDERGLDVARGRDINQEDTSAGIEVSNDTDKTSFKRAIQVGVKTGSSLRPFIRFRLENHWQLGKLWELHGQQDFWHFDEIGFGETTYLNFTRPFKKRSVLNIATEIEYRDNPNPLQYLHEWVINQTVSPKTRLEYKTGALGIVENNEYLQERFIAFTYRRQLNKPWAFINITPQVIFSKENDWQSEGVLTAKLEIFFTD